MALKQIMRELKDLQKDPDNSFKAGPVAEDMFRWKATIMGPPDSPYASGAFPVSIYFSSEYPLKPRRVAFRTKVFHPKIGSNGNICMDILMEKWCPTLTISKLLLSICSLVPKIAFLYKEFRNKYDKTAKSGTQKYAMG